MENINIKSAYYVFLDHLDWSKVTKIESNHEEVTGDLLVAVQDYIQRNVMMIGNVELAKSKKDKTTLPSKKGIDFHKRTLADAHVFDCPANLSLGDSHYIGYVKLHTIESKLVFWVYENKVEESAPANAPTLTTAAPSTDMVVAGKPDKDGNIAF